MLEEIYEFADRSRIFRRIVLNTVLGINVYCFYMTWELVRLTLEKGAMDFQLSAVIAAILTPATALLGKVFQWYNEGRVKNGDSNGASENTK